MSPTLIVRARTVSQTRTQTRSLTPALALIVCFACAVITPSSAEGQFGGLIKKAAAKVATDKAADKVGEATMPAAKGEALTEETLNSVIKGARAADKTLNERDKLRAKQEADEKALNELSAENEGTHRAYNEANSKILDCRSASLSKLDEERQERLQKKFANDAQAMARMQMIAMKYGKAVNEAQQKGDTAAMMKAQLDMQKEILGADIYTELKSDTAKTDTKCGKLPAKPASLVREEKLRASVDVAADSIRTLEALAINAGAQASGLDKIRYLELKERVATILGTLAGRRAPVSYGKDEVALVQQRQGDIEPIKRAL